MVFDLEKRLVAKVQKKKRRCVADEKIMGDNALLQSLMIIYITGVKCGVPGFNLWDKHLDRETRLNIWIMNTSNRLICPQLSSTS